MSMYCAPSEIIPEMIESSPMALVLQHSTAHEWNCRQDPLITRQSILYGKCYTAITPLSLLKAFTTLVIQKYINKIIFTSLFTWKYTLVIFIIIYIYGLRYIYEVGLYCGPPKLLQRDWLNLCPFLSWFSYQNDK